MWEIYPEQAINNANQKTQQEFGIKKEKCKMEEKMIGEPFFCPH